MTFQPSIPTFQTFQKFLEDHDLSPQRINFNLSTYVDSKQDIRSLNYSESIPSLHQLRLQTEVSEKKINTLVQQIKKTSFRKHIPFKKRPNILGRIYQVKLFQNTKQNKTKNRSLLHWVNASKSPIKMRSKMASNSCADKHNRIPSPQGFFMLKKKFEGCGNSTFPFQSERKNSYIKSRSKLVPTEQKIDLQKIVLSKLMGKKLRK